MTSDQPPQSSSESLLYTDFSARRGGTTLDQPLTLMQRHSIHSIVDRHGGGVIESLSRRLVSTFARADDALECARDIRTTIIRLREAAQEPSELTSRTLMAPAPSGTHDRDRWAEIALKISVHLNGVPQDSIVALQTFLSQLSKTPYPAPRPLVGRNGVKTALYTLTSSSDLSEQEDMTRAASPQSGAGVGMFSELVLKVGDNVRVIHQTECPVSIGRSKTCGVVLAGEDVSRVHGRIDFVNEKYFYVDESRNGTYVLTAEGSEVRLLQERILLVGDGVISPGRPVMKQTGQVVRFRCHAVRLDIDNDAQTNPRR